MNKKILAMAAISSLCLFAACSDDSESDPSRAELCATGLTEECLIGTWNLNGAYSVTFIDGVVNSAINPDYNYSVNPSKLEFAEDKSFTYTMSSVAKPSCVDRSDGKVFGEWSVSGTTLTLRSQMGNTCMEKRVWTGTPSIKVNGPTIEMDIPAVFFLNAVMSNADSTERAQTHEIFTISAE